LRKPANFRPELLKAGGLKGLTPAKYDGSTSTGPGGRAQIGAGDADGKVASSTAGADPVDGILSSAAGHLEFLSREPRIDLRG
jgi:hypothetical protein